MMFLPLGLRTIAGVTLQVDKSLEECAQVCGATWGQPDADGDVAVIEAGARRAHGWSYSSPACAHWAFRCPDGADSEVIHRRS